MPDYEPVPAIADEAPWSDRLTEYDDRHLDTLVRLLEARNEGLAKDGVAWRIPGIDPVAEPGRARKAVANHMARAKWMGEDGRDEAELVEVLQSVGIALAPRGGTGGDGS